MKKLLLIFVITCLSFTSQAAPKGAFGRSVLSATKSKEIATLDSLISQLKIKVEGLTGESLWKMVVENKVLSEDAVIRLLDKEYVKSNEDTMMAEAVLKANLALSENQPKIRRLKTDPEGLTNDSIKKCTTVALELIEGTTKAKGMSKIKITQVSSVFESVAKGDTDWDFTGNSNVATILNEGLAPKDWVVPEGEDSRRKIIDCIL